MAFKDIYYDSDADELVVVDDDGSPAALRSGSLTTEDLNNILFVNDEMAVSEINAVIQEASNAASQGEKNGVVFRPGQYQHANAIEAQDNTALFGYGAYIEATESTGGGVINAIEIEHFHIEGFHLDGGLVTPYCIKTDAESEADRCEHFDVIRNRCGNVTDDAIAVEDWSHDGEVSGNVIYGDSTGTAGAPRAIEIEEEANNIIVSNNRINWDKSGIEIKGRVGDDGAYRVIVEANIIETPNRGIIVQGDTHDILIENNIFLAGDRGFYGPGGMESVHIVNNLFDSPDGDVMDGPAIRIDEPAEDVSIHGNKIYDALQDDDPGIGAIWTRQGVNNVFIKDNQIYNSGDCGIRSHGTDIHVTNNDIINPSNDAIRFQGATDFGATGNYISDAGNGVVAWSSPTNGQIRENVAFNVDTPVLISDDATDVQAARLDLGTETFLAETDAVSESGVSSATLDFGGTLDNGEFVWIMLGNLILTDAGSEVNATLDGNTTLDYGYETVGGVSESGQTEWTLAETTNSNAGFSGIIEISKRGQTKLASISFEETRWGRSDDWILRGGNGDGHNPSSLDLEASTDDSFNITARVFRGTLA